MTSRSLDTGWFVSSYSGAGNETCVEVRIRPTAVGVRDAKNRTGGTVWLHPRAWTKFLAQAAFLARTAR
jgi:hypothetical protein